MRVARARTYRGASAAVTKWGQRPPTVARSSTSTGRPSACASVLGPSLQRQLQLLDRRRTVRCGHRDRHGSTAAQDDRGLRLGDLRRTPCTARSTRRSPTRHLRSASEGELARSNAVAITVGGSRSTCTPPRRAPGRRRPRRRGPVWSPSLSSITHPSLPSVHPQVVHARRGLGRGGGTTRSGYRRGRSATAPGGYDDEDVGVTRPPTRSGPEIPPLRSVHGRRIHIEVRSGRSRRDRHRRGARRVRPDAPARPPGRCRAGWRIWSEADPPTGATS